MTSSSSSVRPATPNGPAPGVAARSALPVSFSAFSKAFTGRPAVEDLTFAVDAGRIVGLLGPNGAGKSTSLRGLVGLVRPTSGSALVYGSPYTDLADPAATVGVSMDGIGWNPNITARRHLRIACLAAGIAGSRVEEVLLQVDLQEAGDKRLKDYSTGMRQRLALATALLGDPPLLLLDEPSNGLDPEGMRWLRQLLKRLAAEGRSVLLCSHLLAEMETTIDDVVVLNRRLLFSGTLQEFTDGGRHRLEERYLEINGASRA